MGFVEGLRERARSEWERHRAENERKKHEVRPQANLERVKRIEITPRENAIEKHVNDDTRVFASLKVRAPSAAESRGEGREQMRGLLSAVKLTEFFDLSSLGVPDTQKFMVELMANAFASLSPAEREAMLDHFPALVAGSATTAELFRKTFSQLGPAYIKFMQILAAQPEGIQAKYREAFSREFREASDANTWHPIEEMHHVLNQDLPSWQQKYKIESKPFKVGSIGQIHSATRADGQTVAVKVMRKGAEKLKTGAEVIQETIRKEAPHSALLQHFASTIAKEADAELDFNIEGQVAEKMRMQGFTTPPEIHEAGRRVLVEEKINGASLKSVIEALEKHPDPVRAKKIAEEFSRQIIEPMRHGALYQADPSLGNFMVEKGDVVRVIDLGKHGALGDKAPLFDAVLETMVVAGEKTTLTDDEAKGLAAMLSRLFGEENYSQAIYESVRQGGGFVQMLDRLMRDPKIHVPAELTSALKTCAQWDGAARLLDASFDPAKYLADMYAKLRAQRLPADVRLLQIELERSVPQTMPNRTATIDVIVRDLAGKTQAERQALATALADAFSKGVAPDALQTIFTNHLGASTKAVLWAAQKYPDLAPKLFASPRAQKWVAKGVAAAERVQTWLSKALSLWQRARGAFTLSAPTVSAKKSPQLPAAKNN